MADITGAAAPPPRRCTAVGCSTATVGGMLPYAMQWWSCRSHDGIIVLMRRSVFVAHAHAHTCAG